MARNRNQKAGNNRKATNKRSSRLQVDRAPIATGFIRVNQAPRIKQVGNITEFSGQEMLQSVSTANTATLTLNQALIPSSLPWLGIMAGGFSKFRWKRLSYLYVPSCPTTTSGSFTIGVEYETAEAAPTTQQQLSASYRSVTAPYWGGAEGIESQNDPNSNRGVVAFVDVKRSQKPWYPYKTTANYAALNNFDRNMYSPGQILIVASGGPATAIEAGYIFARYTCECIEPIAPALNT